MHPASFQYCLQKLSLNSLQLTSNLTGNATDATVIPDLSSIQAIFGTGTYSSHRIPEVRQILIYCYAILILCGTTFNLAVLFALLYFREQIFTNIANIFVFTLAASDVVLCGVSMPIQLYYGIDDNSRVNTGLCRTLFAGFGIPMYVSCLTILLIAIDRHRLIVKPTAPRVSIRTALWLILTTVVFSALNAVPVGLYTESRGIEGFRSFCVEAWPLPVFRLVYSIAIFVVHFLLPLLVSGGLYLEIYRRLATLPEQLSLSKESERRKRRTTTLLACVVVCFAICWTPWCVFSLLVEIDAYMTKGSNAPHMTINFSELTLEGCIAWLTDGRLGDNQTEASPKTHPPPTSSFIRGTHFTLVDMILKLWAMGSACVNPFLYGWLNRPIREAMINLYEMISGFCFRSLTPEIRQGNRDLNVLSNRITGRPSKVSYRSSCGHYPLTERGYNYQNNGTVGNLLPNSKQQRGFKWRGVFENGYRFCLKRPSTAKSNKSNSIQQTKQRSSRQNLDRETMVPPGATDVVVIIEGPTDSQEGLDSGKRLRVV
ncbi:unnamed protein product [Mesocestoides corti]|uniref:G-protein coupled receptors family 1 profile domain-containing protein n=1 Tax=Mesocestoides corti TaxID=53468 RepID=A0A0R3UK30_MESCO|nr:unnamed protein product [Mesocestoides corti]